ncbi:hypothetical protein Tco_0844251 [Tanacetum coccineum]
MLDKLGLGDGRILFSHFKIPCTSLDDGLASLMADEDVVKLLEYVPRFREVDVYVKEDVLVVEQHMIEVRVKASLSQDDMDMPWGMVAPNTDDDASINEALVLEAYEVDVDSHLDEALVLEEVGDLGMFDNSVDDDSLQQAYEEDIDSHLGEALVLEEVGDLGFFDNVCAQMVCLEIGQREVDGQLFLGDPVDNEMTKHDAIQNSRSNVPIGRPSKRKRVEYDETNLGYAPTGNPMKRRKLKKDKRYAIDFVDDVEEE